MTLSDSSITLVSTVDLLRHGQCEGGEIFRGTTDSQLTEVGQQQMIRSLPTDANWHQIVTSPLRRCQQFARQLAEQRQLPLQQQASFQEIDFGNWEGQATSIIAERYSDQLQRFWKDPIKHPPPNAESLPRFHRRVVSGWRSLLQSARGQHTLLITHGGVIRIILAELLQMPMRPLSFIAVPHGCFSRIQVFHQGGQEDWPQLIFHNRPLAAQEQHDR